MLNLRDVPDVLTVPEVAKLLRINRNHAYELVKSGAIYAVKCGRSIRVPKAAFIRFLEGQGEPAEARTA